MDEYFPGQKESLSLEGKNYLLNDILIEGLDYLNDILNDLRYNKHKKSLIKEIIEILKNHKRRLFVKIITIENLKYNFTKYNKNTIIKN
jgi:hypothetical protein